MIGPTSEAGVAGAAVVVDEVEAGAVDAGVGQTLVILIVAVVARVSRLAVAVVAARGVDTDAIVAHPSLLSGVSNALIDILVTVISSPTHGTLALVPVIGHR